MPKGAPSAKTSDQSSGSTDSGETEFLLGKDKGPGIGPGPFRLVREPGFEPGTYRLGGGCSIRLSYRDVMLPREI